MSRFRFALAAVCLLFGAAFVVVPLEAALDDFTVVNRTGGTIEELWFISTAVDWEENVLGRHPLHDTNYRRTSVNYYQDCSWDVVAVYGDGSELTWEAIDLCSVWEITLRCNAEACWATFR